MMTGALKKANTALSQKACEKTKLLIIYYKLFYYIYRKFLLACI
jgi:hypothetical protein